MNRTYLLSFTTLVVLCLGLSDLNGGVLPVLPGAPALDGKWAGVPFKLVAAKREDAKTTPLPERKFGLFSLSAPLLRTAAPATDSLPPLRDRSGDFITDPNPNPVDLRDPASVTQTVEYDPETGMYLVREQMGQMDYRPPIYLSPDEYYEYRRKQDERAYFQQLGGVQRNGSLNADDPLAEIDVDKSLINRLFGSNEISITPQGGIDLTFAVDHQRQENPILTERQRSNTIFDFDMDIQMNVQGQIGEKLKLNTAYNTNANFNFDNQIKLDYNSEEFGEDDILKKIEAGNVSLPLRGTLIQGAQSLFGLKTELQFGHLRLTAIASQQQSKRENVRIEGGSQVQEFTVYTDEYDENRHFFLSHYNREVYEEGLTNLPQINTLFHLENIEVWLTNDRNEVQDVRDIVAFSDLGEPERLTNPQSVQQVQSQRYRDICDNRSLPENGANSLYGDLIARGEPLREIDRTVNILQSAEFGLEQSRDFEKIRARKLNPREYTVHPELGFVSLNINVQPDQVVGVAYRYKYNGEIFRVGELSTITDDVSADTTNLTNRVLYVKMLKSTTQRVGLPTWDLMMKNVYSLGAYQVNQEDFRLDVVYEDPGEGFKRFLPGAGRIDGVPLIRALGLDRLNTQGDPQPDGVFDYVPGITINPQNGRIYFPVLEPFGSDLADAIGDPAIAQRFTYQQLYDSTIFNAKEFPEKNRFIIQGSYKSTVQSEISLGAFNIPPGSVSVTAGGALLVEGRDYEVDYSTGRVRILNDAILGSGVPVNVNFEDNAVFGLQQQTMLGLRADYEVNKNLSLGATYLQLFERPFTQKVNIGEDPINNRIYGADLTFNKESGWLTRMIDKLPLLSTSAPSSVSLTAETAYLRPGHSRAVNQSRADDGGIVYVDDFEGTASPVDLTTPVNFWYLSSVPHNDAQNNNPLFPESREIGLVTGANRAMLNWYRTDPAARQAGALDNQNVYTSRVQQQEVFPNRSLSPAQQQQFLFQTFDLAFYPNERGPYNFDPIGGYPGFTSGSFPDASDPLAPIKLADPTTRWGGIMREITVNDFQSANIEFVEFWMLSPFLDPTQRGAPAVDAEQKQGTLYLNLGNISEDILQDSRFFFENGLPGQNNPARPTDRTVWGRVPVSQQIIRGFDNDPATREQQDVGLDGLDDAMEAQQYADYISSISGANPIVGQALLQDPANDNFRYYNAPEFTATDGLFTRYRRFNNPQGNSANNAGNQVRNSSTNIPDAEDLNRDNTLNESEAYFQYEMPLRVDPLDRRRIDRNETPFITDELTDATTGRIWYRFRIPVQTPDKTAVGGIQDFRSIRFARLYMTGFERPTVLRFATFELVRNQWRRYTRPLVDDDTPPIFPDNVDTEFSIDAVNFEENSQRFPFAYTLPLGIQREQNVGLVNTLQNEQSLSLRIDRLYPSQRRAVFKYTDTDMRLYERLKMFVHAEGRGGQFGEVPEDDELSVFIRLGSDFESNYYEYEIPLTISDSLEIQNLNPNSEAYKREVWPEANEFDFPLSILTDLKQQRNESSFSLTQQFSQTYQPEDREGTHTIRVKGNPNLGFVKVFMIGVKNRNDVDVTARSAEVWVNELRLEGLDERGGVAGIARADIQLADLGTLTASGNFSSIGFGALDNSLYERAREREVGYDLAANLSMGRFFPSKWGVRLPLYIQRSQTVQTPEYDPYDLDIRLDEKLDRAEAADRDSIREQAQDISRITSINLTNVGLNPQGGGNGKPMPWDIENFSVTGSYTKTERSDPYISSEDTREYTGALDYIYATGSQPIQPFKTVKSKYLRLISEFNFNPIPTSFAFSTILNRTFATTQYRFAGVEERFNTYYNKRFLWNRTYDLQWNLTKSIRLSFNAQMNATVDEPDESRIALNPEITDVAQYRKDSIWDSLRDFGRPKLYQHNLNVSYTLPLRYLPFMEWVQVQAQYQAGYNWNAAALNADSLGNVIQNTQTRQITADLNFERLYDQFEFLKKINRPQRRNTRSRPTTPRRGATPREGDKEEEDDKPKKSKRREGEVSPTVRALVRPLLLVRRARFTYSENLGTVVPGFTPRPGLLGQSDGFTAPGWDFVAGLQPNIRNLGEENWYGTEDWLYQNRGFLTRNPFLNQDVTQNYTQNYDAQVTLEPFQDFRIDLTLNKQFREDYTETFKVLEKNGGDFEHAIPTVGGSLTITYSALSTLFQSDTAASQVLFDKFTDNRREISRRLGGGIPHDDPNLAERGYSRGYGPNQQEVLLPAFIAAYTDQDPSKVSLNIFDVMPRPNWRVTYNGLQKVGKLRDIFANFSISHGYQSTFTINSYRTGLDYLASRDNNQVNALAFDTVSLNYFPRIEIPDISIQEGFAPLIAIEATLVNGMSFNFDYQRSRNLRMNITSKLLSETQSKNIIGGFGYIMQGVNIGFLTGRKNVRTNREQEEQAGSGAASRGNRGSSRSGGRLQVNDLDIQFNFGLRDEVTYARKWDQGIREPTNGTYTVTFSPSAEYKLNRRLSLRAFLDYRRSVPYNSLGFPTTTASGGMVVRFQLN